jgi:hypothetical protein
MSGNDGRNTANSEPNSDGKARRLANLRPWKPGQSGNPRGRPKDEFSVTAELRKILRQPAGPEKMAMVAHFARRLIELACEGNPTAIREVLARIDPLPQGAVESSGQLHVIVQYVDPDGTVEETHEYYTRPAPLWLKNTP